MENGGEKNFPIKSFYKLSQNEKIYLIVEPEDNSELFDKGDEIIIVGKTESHYIGTLVK